ncbi:CGNR zinc finger domain-containing protein [Actinomadura sp. ATCC 31491]|uniref:CGNR zinc finger domain-containing protein n=1 Tax=Actinomadura luzonensis TaxID=2805427 RepID=A0ABT0G4X8_9ACTN|nr:CGNR zinc finger domain-containing protein [Actinomadura luzonensis]MCK2219665.1 CGNR zinc finger domain-containing protein [Actinomadura luzonensis]
MSFPAELVRDFVNTYDVESDTDELSSPAELAVWLRERGLAGARDRATDDDLHTAHALREGIRAALRREPAALPAFALPALPLRVGVGRDGAPELVPAADGVAGGLARIAAATLGATWERLKVCAEGTCQWAFIDSSRNRSRSWCSMRVCGNRTKTRAYRARKRGSRRLQASNTDTV